MLEKTKTHFEILSQDERTTIIHDRSVLSGPEQFLYDGQPLIENLQCYLDDRFDYRGVVRTSKGYRKGCVDTVELQGYLPLGNEIYFNHKFQYTNNYARISTDLRLTPGTTLKRHFGLGSLVLPGKWVKYFEIPAPQHQLEGAESRWHEIEAGSEGERLMVGHWHRPPTTLTFVREDGVQVEIGTGSDVWRWEYGLGYGPESGSFKIFQHGDRLEIQREPLMCCEEFTAQAREYRFTWFLRWGQPEKAPQVQQWMNLNDKGLPEEGVRHLGIEVTNENLPDSYYKTATPEQFYNGEHTNALCLSHNKTQGQLRTFIRRMKQAGQLESITFRGLSCGPCYNPSHVQRRNKPVVHNDSSYILDFTDWVRQTLRQDEFGIGDLTIHFESLPDQPTYLDYRV